MLFRSTIISLCLSSSAVNAFSGGAGDCPADGAAVGGGHLRSGAQNLSFADLSFEFTVNDVPVLDDTVEIVDGWTYEIGVRVVDDGMLFKGVLIRADDGMLEPSEATSQIAMACTDVPGITHVNALPKTELSGMYTSMGAGPIKFDVTVVQANNATASIYAYEQFQITAVPQGGADTGGSDVNATTTAPMLNMTTTSEPTAAPTMMMMNTTTAVPTTIMTNSSDAPIASPTNATEAPSVSAAPTAIPTNATNATSPTMTPTVGTGAPVMMMTDAPVMSPPMITEAPATDAPVTAPNGTEDAPPVLPPINLQIPREDSSVQAATTTWLLVLLVGTTMMVSAGIV